MSEVELSNAEARAMILSPSFDGYGGTRIYAIFADSSVYAGQITVIKSLFHLDRDLYSRIYAVSNNGTVPIRRA